MPIGCLFVSMGELQHDGVLSQRSTDLQSDGKT